MMTEHSRASSDGISDRAIRGWRLVAMVPAGLAGGMLGAGIGTAVLTFVALCVATALQSRGESPEWAVLPLLSGSILGALLGFAPGVAAVLRGVARSFGSRGRFWRSLGLSSAGGLIGAALFWIGSSAPRSWLTEGLRPLYPWLWFASPLLLATAGGVVAYAIGRRRTSTIRPDTDARPSGPDADAVWARIRTFRNTFFWVGSGYLVVQTVGLVVLGFSKFFSRRFLLPYPVLYMNPVLLLLADLAGFLYLSEAMRALRNHAQRLGGRNRIPSRQLDARFGWVVPSIVAAYLLLGAAAVAAFWIVVSWYV